MVGVRQSEQGRRSQQGREWRRFCQGRRSPQGSLLHKRRQRGRAIPQRRVAGHR